MDVVALDVQTVHSVPKHKINRGVSCPSFLMSDNRYYPEGYFGPVCDPIRQPQEVVVVTVAEEPDQNVRIIDGPREPNDYVRWPFKTECKERILEDGTVELYDCETFFHDDLEGD